MDDEAPLLNAAEIDAEDALPLAVPEPDAPEAAELAAPVVPKPEVEAAAGVVVTVMPKPEVDGGGVYLMVVL